jgi:hypothetical protein
VKDRENRKPETIQDSREPALLPSEPEDALSKLASVASQIARAWISPKGALDLVEEQRR